MNEKPIDDTPNPAPAEEIEPERRAMLKRLGRLATYTPPTLFVLQLPVKATAVSGPPPPPPGNSPFNRSR